MLHFNVAEGTPNGDYPWSFTSDGTSGGNYSIRVENGTPANESVQIFITPGFFWGPNVVGIVTVTGSQDLFVPSPTSAGFYPIDGGHYCCCEYGCTPTTNYAQVIEAVVGSGLAPDVNQTKECDFMTGCAGCSSEPMANYSIHLMLASLHIEDTPISYHAPIGPPAKFKVAYNQREANQPATFPYSNLGPKWTHNWLSYVTDNGPAAIPSSPTIYLRGGGTEVVGGYDPATQSYSPDRQTLAVLVRTSNSSYERRFPNGAKEVFSQSDGATTFPRRIFLTGVVDPAGNVATLTYDAMFRITAIIDPIGQAITLKYDLSGDPLKITRVTDPFGRSATFEYFSGKLTSIIDPIGIRSTFGYESGSDFVNMMATPYGTTRFVKGESGNLIRWLEAIDSLGGRERVEFNNDAPSVASAEAVAPAGFYNSGLRYRNTFYWDKKAMADAPGDYSKAEVFHWLATPEGKISGIKHSEKKALENRVWYAYANQTDPSKVGQSALPIKTARLVGENATQLSEASYNQLGNLIQETDPAGRVKSYRYAPNNIDLLEVYQRNPAGISLDPDGQPADKVASYSYNAAHEPLTETDPAGQVTTYEYNEVGQLLTRRNTKGETTTYRYGGSAPPRYLESIIGPACNGASAVVNFGYDNFKRVRTVTNPRDDSTTTTEYDELDRKISVTYPDGAYEQFQYTDIFTGEMTLDLTQSRNRAGEWTYRHYDSNRRMDSITDALERTALFEWCNCGSLNSITDPNGNVTTFSRDIQNRVYRKSFADSTTVDYLFEGQVGPNSVGATSRLKSSTDALNRRVNYEYSADNNLTRTFYTDSSGNPLNPATPSVEYSYDTSYNRISMMTDGVGVTRFAYYPVSSIGLGAGRLQTIDGPAANDTETFVYDELGRIREQSINGEVENVIYDSLGRISATHNLLGHFERSYDGPTSRLRAISTQTGPQTIFEYYGKDQDRRLQSLQNLSVGQLNLSRFEYTYNQGGQLASWSSQLGTEASELWFEYDGAQQLLSARNALHSQEASKQYDYNYDDAGNRLGDSYLFPQSTPSGEIPGTFVTYTANALNQLDHREVRRNNEPPVVSVLSYDSAGNLTSDGEGKTFEWDAANRLVAISYAGTTKRSEFAYDGFGRRIAIVEKMGTTVLSTKRFVWIGERIAQERDAANAITRRYFYEGEQRSEAAGVPRNYYYTRDHLGSIREVTNGAGSVLAHYSYDPYGKRTKPSEKVDVDFGHTGHYYHTPSGLNLALYRAYHPGLGRWISRDPMEEPFGLNLYQNVQNDPVNRVDPLGLFDFRYYGNWGGPGWTGAQWRPYEDLSPLELVRLSPPIDAQDNCYMQHDLCYSRCRVKNGCTVGVHPNKDQWARENSCESDCDFYLVSCLYGLARQNWHSRMGWFVFSWRHTIR